MGKKKPPESAPPGIPAWMTSYSDMMTNMLCFFILMIALSNAREAGFKDSGIGSYMEKLEALGLPGIRPSSRTLIPKGSPLANYKAPKVDPLAKENWAEHSERKLDEEYDRIQGDVSYTDATGEPFPLPLGLKYSEGSARLTLADRKSLDQLAPTLRGLTGRVEVVGACTGDECPVYTDAATLSLKRATEVVRYLTEAGVPASLLVPIGVAATPMAFQKDAAAESETQRRATLLWWQD